MAINAARMAGEWLSPLSGKDRTSHLIEKISLGRSPEERIPAIRELGNRGDYRAVESLMECCRDQDPEVRRSAIAGLQNLRSGRAVSVLIDRLRDKEELPETRQHAAAALAAIRSFRAMQELRTRYADTGEDSALRFFIGGELDRVQFLVSPPPGPVSSS
jgi:HEAT repeat protein